MNGGRRLLDFRSSLKGFISGSIVAGALIVGFDFITQVILLILAFFVFMDSIVPEEGKRAYFLSTVAFFLLGITASFYISLYGLAPYWVVISIICVIAFYFDRIYTRFMRFVRVKK